MTFENPEVVELGQAEELVQDTLGMPNTEGTEPAKFVDSSAAYLRDAE
jgi:hypothetical protein